MRRFAIVSCLALLFAAAISAQEYGATNTVATKPVNFYLGAGAALPIGAFNDQYGVGLHAIGGVGFNIASVPGLQLMPVVEFHTFALDEQQYIDFNFDNPQGIQVDLGATNMVMIGANGKYGFGGMETPITPYILGGAGVAIVMFGDVTVTNPPAGWVDPGSPGNETKFFYNVGAGAEFGLGQTVSLFVEARYLGIPTDFTDFNMIPITAGIRF